MIAQLVIADEANVRSLQRRELNAGFAHVRLHADARVSVEIDDQARLLRLAQQR